MANHNNTDLEKEGINGYDLHHDHHDPDTALRRLRTAGSLSISPELFEKIYLSPKNQVSNNIRSTFGNPTPLSVSLTYTKLFLLIPLTELSSASFSASHLSPMLSWAGEAQVASELL